jgi:molybdate transport system substrate-binding protein
VRVALALLLAAVAAGCGGDDRNLEVFAASSLRDVLPALDFEATYNFAGSDELAAQIREGADAEVFASAGPRPARELAGLGLLDETHVFATNRLVVVVPADNPAAVETVEDLARPGTKLILADRGVPVGDYARELLTRARLPTALDNVVSLEQDVKGVLGKVALGEADAGIVYSTDARAAGDDVRAIEVPDDLQPNIEYVVGIVDGAGDAARAFVERLLGDDGRGALEAAGFGVP